MSDQGVYIPSFESQSSPTLLQMAQKVKKQKIIVVHSTKGGVGKTTITKNLAHAMVYYGKSVAIVDANSDGNLAEVMNTSYNYTLDHWNQFDERLDLNTALGLLAKDKYGVQILPSGVNPLVFPQTIEKIIKNLSKAFEIIIIDTETKLTQAMISCLDVADKILIVGNNNPNIYPRLQTRMIQLTGDPYGMQGLGIAHDKIHVIVNQKETINIKQVETILQFPVSETFDFEDKVEKTEHQRKSTFYDLPKSKFTKRMHQFTKAMLQDVGYTEPKKKGLFR